MILTPGVYTPRPGSNNGKRQAVFPTEFTADSEGVTQLGAITVLTPSYAEQRAHARQRGQQQPHASPASTASHGDWSVSSTICQELLVVRNCFLSGTSVCQGLVFVKGTSVYQRELVFVKRTSVYQGNQCLSGLPQLHFTVSSTDLPRLPSALCSRRPRRWKVWPNPTTRRRRPVAVWVGTNSAATGVSSFFLLLLPYLQTY